MSSPGFHSLLSYDLALLDPPVLLRVGMHCTSPRLGTLQGSFATRSEVTACCHLRAKIENIPKECVVVLNYKVPYQSSSLQPSLATFDGRKAWFIRSYAPRGSIQ
jgi:hypothetical protein